MYENDGQMEPDIIILTDENDQDIEMEILNYFHYNGDEYAIISEYEENRDDAADRDCYVMKVTPFTDENGEEMETFEMIEDEALEARLLEIANTCMNDDEDPDDEA